LSKMLGIRVVEVVVIWHSLSIWF